MKYMGTKTKLLSWLFRHVNRHAQALGLKPNETVFMDACCGSGAVTVKAATEGYKVVSNDLLRFAYHVARGKTCLPPGKLAEARELIFQINALPPVQGHFYKSYSPAGGRMFLHEENAVRVDAARAFIQGVQDPDLQSYLYYCLIEALSRVDNTVGVQAAYLKSWRREAMHPLVLLDEPRVWHGGGRVFNRDLLELLDDSELRVGGPEEILYIDPPYVSREYAPNYHLYEAVVAAKDPVVRGVTGLPEEYPRSEFCGRVDAVEAFLGRILERTQAQLVVISYSSDSTVPLHRMTSLMLQKGYENVEVQAESYQRYRADNAEDREYNSELLQEYLIIGRPTGREIANLF